MQESKAMNPTEWGLLVLLSVLWGGAFFFVGVAVVELWKLPMPSTGTWLALFGLALFGTAIAYVVFFEILTRAGASNVMLVTLLIPVTALLLGNMFLAEPILVYELAGAATIVLGLLFIDGRLPRRAMRGTSRRLAVRGRR